MLRLLLFPLLALACFRFALNPSPTWLAVVIALTGGLFIF